MGKFRNRFIGFHTNIDNEKESLEKQESQSEKLIIISPKTIDQYKMNESQNEDVCENKILLKLRDSSKTQIRNKP